LGIQQTFNVGVLSNIGASMTDSSIPTFVWETYEVGCNTLNLGYKNFFAHIHKFRCYSSLHIFPDLLLLFSIEEEWLFLIVNVIII
jgi:hypothetical protein